MEPSHTLNTLLNQNIEKILIGHLNQNIEKILIGHLNQNIEKIPIGHLNVNHIENNLNPSYH